VNNQRLLRSREKLCPMELVRLLKFSSRMTPSRSLMEYLPFVQAASYIDIAIVIVILILIIIIIIIIIIIFYLRFPFPLYFFSCTSGVPHHSGFLCLTKYHTLKL
jgi:hypothetical protein